MIQRAPVLLVLLIASFSGFAASSFGPEVAVTPPVTILSSALQTSPAAAPNGDGFLAAWWESRAVSGIYAARIDANGVVVDQRDTFVTQKQGPIAMAGLGRDSLLAVVTCGAIDVFRIDEANRTIDSTTFATTTGVCYGAVSIATNGETIVLAYSGSVSVLDLDLNVVAQFTIDAAATSGAVATDGRDYVVVTAPSSPLAKATHLDHRGAIVATNDIVFPNRVDSLGIASNGTEYLAIAGGPVLGALRLSATATPLDLAKSVQIDSPLRGASHVRIAWGGIAYVVTYVQPPQISTPQASTMLRLDTDGTILTKRLVGFVSDTNFAVRPGRALVIWTISGVSAQPLAVDTLSPVAEARRISYATPDQFTPKVVEAAGTLTAFWRERTFDAQFLKAKTLADGATEKILVTGIAGDYSVGFDGANFVVVFSGAPNTIYVQRFRPDLTPFDQVGIVFSSANNLSQPSAAVGNGRVLITWTEADQTIFSVKEMVLDTTGSSLVLLNSAKLSLGPHSSGQPVAAWNGTEFLVVWAHDTEDPSTIIFPVLTPEEVLARRVASDGTVIDAAPVQVAGPKSDVSWTFVTSNHGDFYAAWTRHDPVTGQQVIFGKRIESTLAMEPGDGTFIGSNFNNSVMVAPYGDGYAVAWDAPNADLTAYSPTLRLIDSAGHPAAAFSLPPMPRIFLTNDVWFASGTLIYTRAAAEPQYGGTLRVFTRTFSPESGRRRAAAK